MDRDPIFAEIERQWVFQDVFRFFQMHVWTHDPRPWNLRSYGLTTSDFPFILYPYQREFVAEMCRAIEDGYCLLVEKSRDMGVSWLVLATFTWYWIKNQSGNDFLFGSRMFQYVDRKGALDTLMEKVRFILYSLHQKLLPKGFNGRLNDKIGMIVNPETGSFQAGEANNANFGTSGRYRSILMDEFPKWKGTDEQAWTSAASSSKCRIVVGTPWGMGRYFNKIRDSGAVKVLTLHWSKHPIFGAGLYHGQHPLFPELKDVPLSAWYLQECEDRKGDPLGSVAQDLDINYLSSGSPYFNNLVIAERRRRLTDAPPVVMQYGFGIEGTGLKKKIVLTDDGRGPVCIAAEPEKIKAYEYRYCISADVAEGLERGDNSVVYVYDRVEKKDVAWYAGKAEPDTLAFIIKFFGDRYHKAYAAPENNNRQGGACTDTLKRIYKNVMSEMDFTRAVDKQVTPTRLGWGTTTRSRSIMLKNLRSIIQDGEEGVLDAEFYTEAMTFRYNARTGKEEAEKGSLDDRVIAQAIKFQADKWLPLPRALKMKEMLSIRESFEKRRSRSWRERVRRREGADYV